MNQQPAAGHFSTILPRTVTVLFSGTLARDATATAAPDGGRPRASFHPPEHPTSSSRRKRPGRAHLVSESSGRCAVTNGPLPATTAQ
jgi:hypothetical protein